MKLQGSRGVVSQCLCYHLVDISRICRSQFDHDIVNCVSSNKILPLDPWTSDSKSNNRLTSSSRVCVPLGNPGLEIVNVFFISLVSLDFITKKVYTMLILNMSHFSYSCKMRCPLNHVLGNCEYIWIY